MPTPLCRRGPRAPQRRWNGGATDVTEKITVGCSIVVLKGSTVTRKRGCRVAEASGGSLMISSPEVQATHELVADLDRLGDQIAEPIEICRSEEHTSQLQSPCNLVCRL